MNLPPWWLAIIWIAFILQAWLSAAMVARFVRLFRGVRHDHHKYTPFATVIVPFKGVDDDLPANLRGLCEQNYPDYQLLLVVESEDDPAYPILMRELAHYPHRKARVLVAGQAGPHEGQKVHNQLFALQEIYDRSDDEHAWVFADSDAVPGPDWLRRIISPLCTVRFTAVTTGYRWLIPQPKGALWSGMASVMNSSVACMLGREVYNSAWGGSMALRADTARKGNLRGLLKGALCDDYQFSRLARADGRRIYFVPQCLVATPVHFSFASLVNFAHRQYLLTRVYSPLLYLSAIALSSLYVLGLFSAVGYGIWGLIDNPRGTAWWVPAGVLLLAHVGDQLRSIARRRVVREALGDDVLAELAPALRLDRWATPLWMTLHCLLIWRAAFGRTMNWRGILYRLDGPQKCTRVTGAGTISPICESASSPPTSFPQ